MPEDARDIFIGEGDARCTGAALHADLREVDRVNDVAVLEIIHQLVGRHDRAVFLGFFGAGADVRHGYDLRMAEQRRFGKVADVLAKPAAVQTAQDGRRIHDRVAGEVEQHGPFLDHRQRIAVEHVPRRVDRRHVQRDVVGAGQQRLQVLHAADFVRQAPGGVDRQHRIKADHLHAHGQRHVGNHRADRPQTDDAERLAADLVTGEAGLFLLEARRHLGGILQVAERLHEIHAVDDAASAQQHAGHHQFLDRVGVGTRGVEDDDSLLAIFGDRNVVDARTGARDGEQRRRHVDALELLTAQEEGVGVGDVTADFVRLTGESIEALDRDLVVGSDLVHGNVALKGGCGKGAAPRNQAATCW